MLLFKNVCRIMAFKFIEGLPMKKLFAKIIISFAIATAFASSAFGYQFPTGVSRQYSDTVVQTTTDGQPITYNNRTPVENYQTAVARGKVIGAEPFSGFGERVTIGAVQNGIIWPDGAFYIPPAIGVQPSIASASANDASAGTGIRSVEVHYLDAALTPRSEFVTLNGITPVAMAATNVRFIQCIHAFTVGSVGYASGTITASSGANTMSQIAIGDIRCRSSARMVPAGKVAYIQALVGGASSGTAAAAVHIEIVATELDTHQFTDKGLFFAHGEVALQDNSTTLSMPIPAGPFHAGTIIAMTFTTDKSVTVTGTWFGWLETAP